MICVKVGTSACRYIARKGLLDHSHLAYTTNRCGEARWQLQVNTTKIRIHKTYDLWSDGQKSRDILGKREYVNAQYPREKPFFFLLYNQPSNEFREGEGQ